MRKDVSFNEYDQVVPGLWVGSTPDPENEYAEFDMLVLCSKDDKTKDLPHFKGVVLRPAFDDNFAPSLDDLKRAFRGARSVAEALKQKKTVLVTCHAGLNRSALVAGLALAMTSKLSATAIVGKMRDARGLTALFNPTFKAIIHRFIKTRRNK